MLTDPDMTEAEWKMKKTATVELANKLDGTDRGDGRVESVDERWRTDRDEERNGGVEGDDGRTDEADGADDVGPVKDRRGQRTVEADGRSNSRQTQSSDEKLYIYSRTRKSIIKLSSNRRLISVCSTIRLSSSR